MVELALAGTLQEGGGETETVAGTGTATATSSPGKLTSPSRIAALTSKIVSFVASPLRYAADTFSPTQPEEGGMMVDEEITVRGRGSGSGGLVGDGEVGAGVRAEPSKSQSTEHFFTPATASLADFRGTRMEDEEEEEEGKKEKEESKHKHKEEGEQWGKEARRGSVYVSQESVLQPLSRSYSHERPAARVAGMQADPIRQEFDPIGLIAFDSPLRPSASKGSRRSMCADGDTSLLDIELSSAPLSPSSQPRFSERQLASLQTQMEERSERHIELLQVEIATLGEKYAAALRTGEEMRALLAEYERTMAQMFEHKQQSSEHSSTAEQLQMDLQAMQIAFANLKQRYEEAKMANEQLRLHEQGLRANVVVLQTDLASADRRYEALKQHAEEKLEEANEELHRLRTTLEIELSTTRAKLHKSELKVTSLESTVEAKSRENAELMAICDELIQKIDSQATAAGSSRSAAFLASLNIPRGGPDAPK